MGRGNFTKTEMEALLRNPYVSDVNEKSISYSTEFKFLFMEEYIKGKRPTQIFRDAGFDIKILGSKRIERACARWKESYQSGTLGERSAVLGKIGSSSEDGATPSEKMESGKKYTIDRCRQQEEMIKKLRAEIELLRLVYAKEQEETGRSLPRMEICQIIATIAQQEEYRRCISHLCKAAGISRNTFYEYRRNDPVCEACL